MTDNNNNSCDDLSDSGALSVEQAKQTIINNSSLVNGRVSIALTQARDRVLAEDICSHIDVPGHTNSAMDGYALLGDTLPSTGSKIFRLVGKSLAGSAYQDVVPTDSCVRVTTGCNHARRY